MRRNFITKSYKHKLRASYTMIMLMVLLAIGGFMYFQVVGFAKPLADQSGQHQVNGDARLLGEKLRNQKRALEQLASAETFKSGSLAEIREEVDNEMDINSGFWTEMKYTDLAGNIYDKKTEESVVTSSFENQLVSTSNKTMIAYKKIDSSSDSKIIIGTKIFDGNGKLKGLLIINAYLGVLLAPFENQNGMENSSLWVLDSNGNVMVDPNLVQKQFKKVAEFKYSIAKKSSDIIAVKAQNGATNLLIYTEIANSNGLYLAMMVNQADYTSGLRYILIFLICSALTACILIFIAANKMTNFMTKPLTRMVDIIEQSNGVNSIEIPKELMDSRDEIGILAKTIDSMSTNIRSYVKKLNTEIEEKNRAEDELILLTDELEDRVEQRTFELTTAKNNLAVSEDRFRIAMEVSEIGLYDTNSRFNQTVVNGAFLKLINAPEYRRAKVKESEWVPFECKFDDYIYEDDLAEFPQFGANNQLMIQQEFHAEFRLKDDPTVWLSFVGQAVEKDEDGVVTRFIGVLQNITERKNYEVDLRQAKNEAEEASLAKSQFLANMSHEIRTPMNAIMGLTHLISQSELNQAQKNYVSKISGASASLLRIINDILDFSKIEAGKLEVEQVKFNLYKVLENISNLYTTSATSKGIDINFDIDENVPEDLIGDPLRLEQIISNLITNAIKFTDHGEVNLLVRLQQESDTQAMLKFTVSDTGIGMTKEQIDKLFSAFTQADGSMTRKYGGTGLGLTISKQLVELMNGQIWVESIYEEGSTFHFTVQFNRQLNIEKPDYADYPDLKGRRVLVVDHNRTSLKILERMLKSFSLEATAIREPSKALELLKNQEFDLLVLDFNLPEISGIDLYKRIAAKSGVEPPKTIFVSAIGRESYYTQVNQLGVRNLLVKPINQSLLFDAVISALKDIPSSQTGREFVEQSQEKYRKLLNGKHILLVEDNDINQLVARDMLEQAGIDVSLAENGQEAVKLVHSNRFDLVLMDVQMPVMDGYQATEIIRKSHSSIELPIIAMTANALKGDREKSIEAGMNDYVSKPINPELLFETLVKWMHSSDKKLVPRPKANKDESTGIHVDQKQQLSTIVQPTSIDQANISEHQKENEQLSNLETPEHPVPVPPPSPLTVSIADAQILDQRLALTRLGDKQELLMELLKRYTKSYSDLSSDLKRLQGSGQQEEERRLIHSLKSVTGNIGAMKLNQFILTLEQQYDALLPEEKTVMYQQLDQLNQELLSEIKKMDVQISEMTSEQQINKQQANEQQTDTKQTSKQQMDEQQRYQQLTNTEQANEKQSIVAQQAGVLQITSADLMDALEKLRFALDKARAKEVKEFMALIMELSVKETQISPETVKLIAEIKKQVERYRFKDAKRFVDELLKNGEE